MGRKWSVRRLLQTMLVVNALAVLLVGVIGAWAVHETTGTVDTLSQELSPAQQSNARFMEAMLDSETELRAFLISGEESQLDDYRAALALAPRVERDLHTYAADHPDMAAMVARQDRAAKAWVTDFARVAVRSGGGPGSYQPALYETGVRRFDAIKAANQQIATTLQAEVLEAREASQDRLATTFALIAGVGLLGALGCTPFGSWALRSIRQPLSRLESVVDRLASGDLSARAPTSGPTEIRRLGAALNDLAEESSRARDLEQHVQQQLMDVDRAKSEFVSNVSHELRTPLTSISGYLELLTEELADKVDASEREMLEITRRNVVRLHDLIEDLLDLSSVEHLPEHLEQVDVSAVLEDVAKDLRFSAGSRRITISVDPRRGGPGRRRTRRLRAAAPGDAEPGLERGEVLPRGRRGPAAAGRLRRGGRGQRRRPRDRHPERGPVQAGGAVLPGLERGHRAHPGHRPGAADGAVDREQPPRDLRPLLGGGSGDHGHAAAAPAPRCGHRAGGGTDR
jgi:signal transduction histidine kinase